MGCFFLIFNSDTSDAAAPLSGDIAVHNKANLSPVARVASMQNIPYSHEKDTICLNE